MIYKSAAFHQVRPLGFPGVAQCVVKHPENVVKVGESTPKPIFTETLGVKAFKSGGCNCSSMEELGEVVSTTVTQVVESVVSVTASVSHTMVIVTTALTTLVAQSMSLVAAAW